MPKTSQEAITRLIQQAYDPKRVESLYRQQCYAFGDAWDKAREIPRYDGLLLDTPDITVKYLESGQSRRILNAAFSSMARVMYSQPSPEFPQVPKEIGEVRKQFFLARSTGGGVGDAWEWGDENAFAYLDGRELGFGGVFTGLTTNPVTGYQRVMSEHIPACHIITDRHYRNPAMGRFMAFVRYLTPETAADMFGTKLAKANERTIWNSKEGLAGNSEPLRVVRVIDYWDMGINAKGAPTHAYMLGDIGGKIAELDENPYGFIPFAHYLYFVAPGMRFPIGRVAMQMSTHEALNEVERYMRAQMGKVPIDTWNINAVNQDDLDAVLDGRNPGYIRFIPGENASIPLNRIPAGEPANGAIQWGNMLSQQYNSDSGQTEFDRGQQLPDKRTLGEAELMVNRSQAQGVWDNLQAIRFYQRLVSKTLHVAALFDRDPIEIDVFGATVTLNDPDDPDMEFGNFMRERSSIVIGEESLQYRDQQAERAGKLQELAGLADLVQAGAVDLNWWAEERLKAMGRDPKEALVQQQQPGTMQGPGGMPVGPDGMPVPGTVGAEQLPPQPQKRPLSAPTR